MRTRGPLRRAEALRIGKARGSETPRWIAERIDTLDLAGGIDGVERGRAIAKRIDRLSAGGRH